MSDTMAADHPNMQYSMVKEFYVHPHYDARRWAHDVALVKIETAFVLNDYVNVICLPIPTMQGHFHGGVKATVAAFGNPMMKMGKFEYFFSFFFLVYIIIFGLLIF